MGWKEREREIRDALSILKGQQAKIGAPGLRLHEGGMVDRVARIKALELGPCRICKTLRIKHGREEKGAVIRLKCEHGKSPLELHRPFVYRPGEIPSCKSLVPFEQEE